MKDKVKLTIGIALFIGLLFLIGRVTYRHGDKNTCLPIKLFRNALYIESYQDQEKCIYNLNDFFGDGSDNYFYLNDGKGYIGSNRTPDLKAHLLFSFNEPIGTSRHIKFRSGDWVNGEGGTMKMRTVQVVKMNQIKCSGHDVIHFMIRANMYYIKGIGLLDINIIFSNNFGFTGNFQTDPNEPTIIIGVEGEIYEDCLGFNKFERYTIK